MCPLLLWKLKLKNVNGRLQIKFGKGDHFAHHLADREGDLLGTCRLSLCCSDPQKDIAVRIRHCCFAFPHHIEPKREGKSSALP